MASGFLAEGMKWKELCIVRDNICKRVELLITALEFRLLYDSHGTFF